MTDEKITLEINSFCTLIYIICRRFRARWLQYWVSRNIISYFISGLQKKFRKPEFFFRIVKRDTVVCPSFCQSTIHSGNVREKSSVTIPAQSPGAAAEWDKESRGTRARMADNKGARSLDPVWPGRAGAGVIGNALNMRQHSAPLKTFVPLCPL